MKMIGNKIYALDTNVIIDLFKGHRIIADKINDAREIYLPIPVLGELYFGAEKSSRKSHHYKQIERLLRIVDVVNTTEQTCVLYGSVKAELIRKGNPIPENDVWIAALTLEHHLPLVTKDHHFEKISQLKIVSWD